SKLDAPSARFGVRFTPRIRHVQRKRRYLLHPRKRTSALHSVGFGSKADICRLMAHSELKMIWPIIGTPGPTKRNTALECATSRSAKVVSQTKAFEHHPSGRRF